MPSGKFSGGTLQGQVGTSCPAWLPCKASRCMLRPGMAKGAVIGLTLSLAAGTGTEGASNAIAPSLTRTPLSADMLVNDQVVAAVSSMHAMQRARHCRRCCCTDYLYFAEIPVGSRERSWRAVLTEVASPLRAKTDPPSEAGAQFVILDMNVLHPFPLRGQPWKQYWIKWRSTG